MYGRGFSFLRGLAAAFLVAAGVTSAVPALATNDAEWGRQWGPQRVGVEQAFAAGVTGSRVRIGIVDTGVDLSHQDLAGKIADHAACIDTKGDQARCSRGGGQDKDGHGTHVAGIAAAVKDNGLGISGVAPGADLVVARVFKGLEAEGARVSDVNAGIKWVVDNGAKVVNLSLGDALPLGELFGSSSLNEGIAYAWSRGAVAVLAAGNTNYFGFGTANYGPVDAVVVGGTGREDEPSSYSSPTGDAKWALVAPGGNSDRGGQTAMIFSTVLSNQYGYKQGTSMAAPHVSGALALLMSQGKSNADAVSRLLATVNSNVPCGSNSQNCRGRLDVACAVTGRCGPALATGTGTTAASPAPEGGGSSAEQAGAGTSDAGGTASGGGSGSGAAPAGTSGGTGAAGAASTSGAKAGTPGSGTTRSGAAGARIAGRPGGAGTPTAAAPGPAPVTGEAAPGVPGAPPASSDVGSDPEKIGLSFFPPDDESGSEDNGPSVTLVATAAALLVALCAYGWRRRRAGL